MEDPKNAVAASISRAQRELVDALAEIERITTVGAGSTLYVAHALNNYLCVTGAAVELIAKRLSEHPDPQIREWLGGVSHATELMANLVAQLMSAAVTTETKLHFERVDIDVTLQRFCDFYRRLARQKRIDLTIEPHGDIPPVWTDRVAMLSVFDNLVSNAIKYSEAGKRVWLRLRTENDAVICEVRDEGPGLSPADHARLFERGARLTPRPTAGESSTGYGLAVTRDLVTRLAGEIWCESTLGQGAAFFVRLPMHRESTQSDHD